jgi:FkbM family methyltransferase
MKYSIVIPTYNHCDDLLKPCIESILKYTDMSQTEIVVVANGCVDNTKEYLQSLSGQVRYVWKDDAQGYPKAVNLGILASKGTYVVLLNNDTVLLDQPKNLWLDMLVEPFGSKGKVGVTGPVKFDWDCSGIRYDCMAFWLVMIPRHLFQEIGLLDEIFSPGMGEDGDFCVKAVQNGYQLISVPKDVKGSFETGIVNYGFPIWHKGNGTFNDDTQVKLSTIEKNNVILAERYGKKKIEVSIVIPTYNHLDDALRPCIEAVLAYTNLQNKEVIVVANGCTDGTREFLDSLSDKIKYIWFDEPQGVIIPYNAGIDAAQGEYIVTLDNDSILQPQPIDQWIDILKKPFLEDSQVGGSSPFANEYEGLGLLLHSGCTMYRADLIRKIGKFDTDYYPGYFCDPDLAVRIWKAGYKCIEVPAHQPNKKYQNGVFDIQFPVVHMGTVQTMNKHKDIKLVEKNRMLLYAKHTATTNTKYTIIIPTYNHCDDLLKPCCDSIKEYTDLYNVEVLIVANGCVDNTREYAESLGAPFKLIWIDEQLGYTKAVNKGLAQAQGEYIILLNNDTLLLPQPKNTWINMMQDMFVDPKMGMVGPLKMHDDYSDVDCIIFFCAMIKREMFDKLGFLDEIYSPGGGEDIDFSAKVQMAGYKIGAVTSTEYVPNKSTNVGGMPIWHKDNQTFKHIPEYTKVIMKRNGLINAKRYNKNIKLNLGSGGIAYPGYLSVDMHDYRAHIMMDITKLDFDDNSVTEILASHVFEHLNPYHSIAILQEWLRVLKPGGKLIMEMPDLEQVCKMFVTATTGERYGLANVIYGSVNTTGVGGPDNITSPHLFGWWPDSIRDHLWNAGFRDIKVGAEEIPHPPPNFRVEAMKPYNTTINREDLKRQEPATFIELFEHNGYGVIDSELANNTVIDIGANIGIFSLLAVERGAAKVISIEAQPIIYNLGLLNNIKNYPQIEAYNLAGYSKDDEIVYIPNHHVGSKLTDNVGDAVKTISLASILSRYKVTGNDLALKLDCEGSEFDILLSSNKELIRRFAVIYIEIHGNTNKNPAYHSVDMLRQYIKDQGYECKLTCPIMGYPINAPPFELGIYVEKYVRV